MIASNADAKRVIVSKEGALGWLRIDNPKRMNAMSFSMWGDLLAGVNALEADDEIRVIIVCGNGDQAFCAGGDISEFENLRAGADSQNSYDVAGSAAMKALCDVTKPTLALIKGYCLGGGLGIALQCDLRFAAETAKLGIPASKRAITYSFDGVKQLVDLVGPSNAKDILYTARQIEGRSAREIGLINETLPDEDLDEHVRSIALKIAENAPLSIRASKLMVNMATTDPALRKMELCTAAEIACLESDDYAEATRSFIEKRHPKFIGR